MGKSAPTCRVCAHDQRHLIELGLVHRIAVRVLARRFALSKTSIFRHRRLHMSPQMIAAIAMAAHPTEVDLEALQRSESEGLIRQPRCPASSAPDAFRDGLRGG